MTSIRRYKLNNTNPSPHTGELLSAYLKQKRIYKSALARALNRNPSTLAAFQKNETIQTSVLWEICHALRYNFFADIAQQLPPEYNAAVPEKAEDDATLKALQNEIMKLKIERDLLLKLVEKG